MVNVPAAHYEQPVETAETPAKKYHSVETNIGVTRNGIKCLEIKSEEQLAAEALFKENPDLIKEDLFWYWKTNSKKKVS